MGLKIATQKKDKRKINLYEEEFRLYYVATTRALAEILNAKHLPRGLIKG